MLTYPVGKVRQIQPRVRQHVDLRVRKVRQLSPIIRQHVGFSARKSQATFTKRKAICRILGWEKIGNDHQGLGNMLEPGMGKVRQLWARVKQ